MNAAIYSFVCHQQQSLRIINSSYISAILHINGFTNNSRYILLAAISYGVAAIILLFECDKQLSFIVLLSTR